MQRAVCPRIALLQSAHLAAQDYPISTRTGSCRTFARIYWRAGWRYTLALGPGQLGRLDVDRLAQIGQAVVQDL